MTSRILDNVAAAKRGGLFLACEGSLPETLLPRCLVEKTPVMHVLGNEA